MIILLFLLMVAVFTDARTDKIPNRLIITGLFLGLGTCILEEGVIGVPHWIFRISIPIILFYILFFFGTLGAGDIKLFSVIAGFLTMKEFFTCVTAAFLAAGVIALGKLIFSHKVKNPHTMHFSVPILAGYLYYCQGVMN